MGHIFISYKSCDSATATRLCQFLEEHSLTCWIAPRDIRAGEDFAGEITRAIRNADSLIVIISSQAGQSGHVLNEVSLAFDRKITIIPYCLSGSETSDGMDYYLATKHRIEQTSDQNADFDNILKAIVPYAGREEIAVKRHRFTRTVILSLIGVLALAMIVLAWVLMHRDSPVEALPSSPTEQLTSSPTRSGISQTEEMPERVGHDKEQVGHDKKQVGVDEIPVVEEKKKTEIADDSIPELAEIAVSGMPEQIGQDWKSILVHVKDETALNDMLSDIESVKYGTVNLDTDETVIHNSYLVLINKSDGKIVNVLSPASAAGTRTSLITGDITSTVNYSRDIIVKFILGEK